MVPVAVAGVAVALLTAGCGNSGQALARQACGHIGKSIALYREAGAVTNSSKAGSLRTKAVEQLELALPLAARATSADPQWNPLMTTLEESGFNTESHLIPALHAQCQLADSQNEQAPVVAPNGSTVTTVPSPTSPHRG
ncbi:MAG: hypothetical protein M0Z95_23815 [Actinomycetota bacterium]|jgi:hypothetical protein|nr:hypothetical protein [Actinomycetota bacterium]